MIDGLDVLNTIIAVITVTLGLFLFLSHGMDRPRLYFALLSIVASVWIVANHFGDINEAETFILILLDYITGAVLVLLYWLFSHELRLKVATRPYIAGSAITIIILAAVFTTLLNILLIVSGYIITNNPLENPPINESSLYIMYPTLIFCLAIPSLYNFTRALIDSKDRIQRSRVKYVFSGLFIAFVCIAIPNLLLQNLSSSTDDLNILIKNLAHIGVVASLALSTYAIIKKGLFDIKSAAVRTLGYVISLITLSIIYYALAYVLSLFILQNQKSDTLSTSPVNVFIAIFIAFLFQPIKSFFDKWSNRIFYRDSYKVDEFYARLSNILSSTVDLRSLLEQASKQIALTLKSSQAFFLIFYEQEVERHMSAGTRGHTHMLMHDVAVLKDLYIDHNDSFIRTELLEEGSPLQNLLNAKNINIVLPLQQNGKTIGYLFLGEHLSSGYSARDTGVLSTISNELVIAIQNALSLQEVKDLNATLQQRILAATGELRSSNSQLKHLDEVKDEFISMASHQLRTPLTSIKGYLSMVLEGDVGNISAQQRSLLHEAFKSSERMVRLITDFLNVSRLQTGKFIIEKALFDLSSVVIQEVDNLSVIAKNRNLTLRLVGADGPLPVLADESKIRQVIMNYVDNAIYYSKQNGTIIIKIESTKRDAMVSVIDTGIGVPHAEQEKLFKKFYRAPNARKQRPDGTGVGLFLARRVIEEHKGKIIFSSKEGKGSTFGFSLPLADALASDLTPDESSKEVANIAQ